MNQCLLSVFLIAGIFTSCDSDTKILSHREMPEVLLDSLPGECPYLTKDNKGNTIASWTRIINDSLTAFCYAVSKDGKKFSKPFVIPNSGNIQPHGENLPKILFKPSGEILALWGAANPNQNNKYSGLVYYVQSFDDGKSWTIPRKLVNDTASYDQRYYDVALLRNGEAGIIWLDNRKTTSSEGSGLYFASTEGRNGFLHDRLISQPCCQCCRTDLFVDNKGFIHTLYRGIIQDSIRDMVHSVSKDGGKAFAKPVRISDDNWVINGCPHTGPSMTETNTGLAFAWFTGGKNKGCYFSGSKDNGNTFSERDEISQNGSHPQLTHLSDDNVVVVWDEGVQVGDRNFRKIGIQSRDFQGANTNNIFITPDTATAAYPVIATIGNKGALVAYTRKHGYRNYITCQVVQF